MVNGDVKILALDPFSPKLITQFCPLSSDVTSWRDGGGRALAPTLPGEGSVEGGTGGNVVMDGAAGAPPPNPQSHGPPRNPPAGSPALPLAQPPVGPGFPQYRGIMPPFVSISFLFQAVGVLFVVFFYVFTGKIAVQAFQA